MYSWIPHGLTCNSASVWYRPYAHAFGIETWNAAWPCLRYIASCLPRTFMACNCLASQVIMSSEKPKTTENEAAKGSTAKERMMAAKGRSLTFAAPGTKAATAAEEPAGAGAESSAASGDAGARAAKPE